jgi:hypothetical protein
VRADFGRWLQALGLEQYADVFGGNDRDMSLLTQEADQVMNDAGVTSVGCRLCLINAVVRLKLVQVITNAVSYTALEKLRTVNSTYLVSGKMHR